MEGVWGSHPQVTNAFFSYTHADVNFHFEESSCKTIPIFPYCAFATIEYIN